MYWSIKLSSWRKYSWLLIMSPSLKVWFPMIMSGNVPLARSIAFCSPQSFEETTCHLIFTFVRFSRSTSHWFLVKESPISPQRIVNAVISVGSLNMGKPVALKPDWVVSADFLLHPPNASATTIMHAINTAFLNWTIRSSLKIFLVFSLSRRQ